MAKSVADPEGVQGVRALPVPVFKYAMKMKLEDLTVLKRSPDLLYNVKIGQDQLRLIMKHILFYGGCGHFGQVT